VWLPCGNIAGAETNRLHRVAATSVRTEAVLLTCPLMATRNRNDIRIEAAIAKLYSSKMAWTVADELCIRGGRWLRDRRVVAARGESRRTFRAYPSRPAHQPHFGGST